MYRKSKYDRLTIDIDMMDCRMIVYTIVRYCYIEHHEFVMSSQGSIKFLKIVTDLHMSTFHEHSMILQDVTDSYKTLNMINYI